MAKKEEKVVPLMTDPAWDDYVMSLFDSNELVDGHPNVAGLRRMARLLLGEIIVSKPTAVFASEGNKTTVCYEVMINCGDGRMLNFGDVADVTEYNTDLPFCLHPAAVASTRAEARALRKALCLKKASSEELNGKNAPKTPELKVKVDKPTTGEVDPSTLLTDNQKVFISNLCKKLSVSATEFLEKGKNVDDLNRTEASALIDKLRAMQTTV